MSKLLYKFVIVVDHISILYVSNLLNFVNGAHKVCFAQDDYIS